MSANPLDVAKGLLEGLKDKDIKPSTSFVEGIAKITDINGQANIRLYIILIFIFKFLAKAGAILMGCLAIVYSGITIKDVVLKIFGI